MASLAIVAPRLLRSATQTEGHARGLRDPGALHRTPPHRRRRLRVRGARGRARGDRPRAPPDLSPQPTADGRAEGDEAVMPIRLGGPVETPDVQDVERTDLAIAPPWMTILHNCDCHTFEEVVKQLMKAIGCSEERGWELAWQVHNTGKAVVKVAPETDCVRVGNVLAAIGLIVTVTQS